MHEAAWRGYSQTVTVLSQHKANVNAVNRAGFTPLHLCCQNGHNETCRVLLWADANPDAKNHVSFHLDFSFFSISLFDHIIEFTLMYFFFLINK